MFLNRWILVWFELVLRFVWIFYFGGFGGFFCCGFLFLFCFGGWEGLEEEEESLFVLVKSILHMLSIVFPYLSDIH